MGSLQLATDGSKNTDKEIDEEVITTDRIGNTDIETLLPKNLTGAGKTGENFPTNQQKPIKCQKVETADIGGKFSFYITFNQCLMCMLVYISIVFMYISIEFHLNSHSPQKALTAP